MAGWGLVLLCCVHLTAQTVLGMLQGVSPGNTGRSSAASLSTAIAIVPTPGDGGSWAAPSPCPRVWDQGAMSEGFGRAEHHPWLFSWLSGISLARPCPSMPRDIQLQADVELTGRSGEGLCARLGSAACGGIYSVCGDSHGTASCHCPQSAHWDPSASGYQSRNPPGECLWYCGQVGHPGHWSKLVFLRKPSRTVTCWDQVSSRAGREWFGRQLEWKALVGVQV